jgi:PilZ domain
MPKPINHYEREVRRARRLLAWIKVQDRTIAECHVMDISNNGAKIAAATASPIPDHFQLSFFEGDQARSCEVIWRHGKVFGVRFAL